MFKKLLNSLFNGRHRDAISFRQGLDLTELPCVTLYQGENKVNLLLDTGSNSCIIDSNALDNIQHTKSDVKFNLFGMEGNKAEVSTCNICLEYKGKTYEYEFLVRDMQNAFGMIKQETGVTLHGILGSKFFNKFKYVLDFDELIAYSKS